MEAGAYPGVHTAILTYRDEKKAWNLVSMDLGQSSRSEADYGATTSLGLLTPLATLL